MVWCSFQYLGIHNDRLIVVDSTDLSKGKTGDHKVFLCSILIISLPFCPNFMFPLYLLSQALRRLAQNREAARKSRMRKKVIFNDIWNLLVAFCGQIVLFDIFCEFNYLLQPEHELSSFKFHICYLLSIFYLSSV